MRSCFVTPSLAILTTILKSSPAIGANNVFQDGAQNPGAGAAVAAGAVAGPGWTNNVETDDGSYIDIPYGCHELDGKQLEDCIDQWYDEYYTDEDIPDECVKLTGLELHNCIELYLSSLSASPTFSPTSGSEPPTPPPSVEEIYHTASLPNDVTTMVELPSDGSSPDETSPDVSIADDGNTTDQDLTIVYVNEYVELGNFDMSITIYSTPRTDSRRHRNLHDDHNEEVSFSQEHELAATKYFLQQVYQEKFPDLKVNALQLRFIDGGETIFSQGVIRHSSFNGTVGFESAIPSEEELESATLDAFAGKTNKATFLELFHSSFAEGSNEGNVDVVNLYDVSVQKSEENEVESTQGVAGVVEDEFTMEKSQPQQTVQDNSTGNGSLILLVICVVVVAVVLLLGSVYFRGRRAEQQKARSHLTFAKYDDEKVAEKKFDNDEEKRFQYDNTTLVCTSSGNKDNSNSNEEESIQSSLSSNLPDETEQPNFEQPYPLEISPSYLEEINNQSLREDSDLKLSQDEQDGNASTAWTFSAVGADIENRSNDGASIGYSVGGVSDIIRNMTDFEEMVVSTKEYDEEKGQRNQIDYEDDQLSFLGSVSSNDFNPEDKRQIDSFIKEILSRDDLDAEE